MIRPLLIIIFVISWYLSFYWGLRWNEERHVAELEEALTQADEINELIYKTKYEIKLRNLEEEIRRQAADEFLDILQTTCENSGSISISNSQGREQYYVCTSATFL